MQGLRVFEHRSGFVAEGLREDQELIFDENVQCNEIKKGGIWSIVPCNFVYVVQESQTQIFFYSKLVVPLLERAGRLHCANYFKFVCLAAHIFFESSNTAHVVQDVPWVQLFYIALSFVIEGRAPAQEMFCRIYTLPTQIKALNLPFPYLGDIC